MQKTGAVLLGVSPYTPKAQKKFKEKEELPFTLLADADKKVAEASVEEAVVRREIVRTWPMRGTLHFVAAADVRWLLPLLTPRVIAGAASRYRQLELDEAVFARASRLAGGSNRVMSPV